MSELDFRVWKFILEITGEQHVEMPEHPHILSAQFQGGQLCVWALVAANRPTRPHCFQILGTGNPVTDDLGKFVATVQQPGRPLVWHIFEKTARSSTTTGAK